MKYDHPAEIHKNCHAVIFKNIRKNKKYQQYNHINMVGARVAQYTDTE